MGLFRWLFSRKKRDVLVQENEDVGPVYNRINVDFLDKEDRTRYVTACLEQILASSKEMNQLSKEYQLVTCYLTDTDEIEGLPEGEKENLKDLARHIETTEGKRQNYLKKKNRMSDGRYEQLEKQEGEIEDGIKKLVEAEKYQKLIKQDLSKLDGERHAYEYRKSELKNLFINLRGVLGISLGTVSICIVMLLVLQFFLEMKVAVGYYGTVAGLAIVFTVIYFKYSNAKSEMNQVQKALNRLIQLQNTVKIRFVNNINLMDYLYLKYNVKNSAELMKFWNLYLEEKEERKQYEKTVEDREHYENLFVERLKRFRVHDPYRWIHQTKAILDSREMVEIRHSLILRRQSLRKQMDFNQDIVEKAKKEVKNLVQLYPKYAGEITDLVEEYEKMPLE